MRIDMVMCAGYGKQNARSGDRGQCMVGYGEECVYPAVCLYLHACGQCKPPSKWGRIRVRSQGRNQGIGDMGMCNLEKTIGVLKGWC